MGGNATRRRKEAWGRLAKLEAGSSCGGVWGVRICPACCTHYSVENARSSRGLQTYRTSRQWTSYSTATDGPEMDLVEVRSSSTWSPQDLVRAGVGDMIERWKKERQSWTGNGRRVKDG